MTKIEDMLERIATRRPRIIDLSLDRVFAALDKLGNPHRKLPPTFHVAGTNGKGSTIAFLRAILEAAGNSVHVYTSPHLVRFNERIVLAGHEIDDAHLIDALERCDEAASRQDLTYFETATCAAFLAFAETPADYLLLEVGLGGRLDATNVLDKPMACVITPIGRDHEKFLGDTVEKIAAEKAGIFRPQTPAIIGAQSPEAMTTLLTCADTAGANPFVFGQDWTIYAEHGRLAYQDETGLADIAAPRLVGAHQVYNAGLAIAATRAAGLSFSDDTLSDGLVNARWPARMQRLTRGRLVEQAGASELWLDGGHNPHAAAAIARALADLNDRDPKPLALIISMQDNKDAAGYFTAFKDLAAEVFVLGSEREGAAAVDALVLAAKSAGLEARAADSVERALEDITATCKKPPRVFLGGSLYFAGSVLTENG
ncbi:MAG: folylpolyglutamate synthase/dihydrofolate synthase family protein [Pseudomonadota bacterium]